MGYSQGTVRVQSGYSTGTAVLVVCGGVCGVVGGGVCVVLVCGGVCVGGVWLWVMVVGGGGRVVCVGGGGWWW